MVSCLVKYARSCLRIPDLEGVVTVEYVLGDPVKAPGRSQKGKDIREWWVYRADADVNRFFPG